MSPTLQLLRTPQTYLKGRLCGKRARLAAGVCREVAVVQVIYERCAGVDVGKDEIAVAVRVPGKGGRRTEKRTYRAFYGVLREMARWLESQGVTHVAMEATGSYSMPVYHALMEGVSSRCWSATPGT